MWYYIIRGKRSEKWEKKEKDQNGVKLLEHPEKIENDQIENTENLQEENKEKEIEKITEEKKRQNQMKKKQ